MFHQRKASARTQLFGSMSILVVAALLVFQPRANSAQVVLSTPGSCTSDSECEEGYCCRLSMSRYSIPMCEPMRTEGELCRKASERTHSINVTYPSGEELQLKGVHLVMCACAPGLDCDNGVCVRR